MSTQPMGPEPPNPWDQVFGALGEFRHEIRTLSERVVLVEERVGVIIRRNLWLMGIVAALVGIGAKTAVDYFSRYLPPPAAAESKAQPTPPTIGTKLK